MHLRSVRIILFCMFKGEYMSNDDVIIDVQNVTVRFNLMEERVDSLKEYLIRLMHGKMLFSDFIAVNDVSFQIKRGDIVGIIGFNGAGKSTLLKTIAGVLKPTKGKVITRGSIAPLIEVGVGFDMDLTARENIFLNGALLGYSRNFIQQKFDEIVDFAELWDFLDVPVKNFSSGMYARLGFSIATTVEPDILIVDEILSVGDFKFQEKSRKRIEEMIDKGGTVVIVSHEMKVIEELCHKVVWLEHGCMKMYGRTDSICSMYKSS